jgi:HK97 family phage prohead protease
MTTALTRRTHRDLSLAFQVKAMDDEARSFSGLAAAFSQDLGGDVILPGAFKRTLSDWRKAKAKLIPLMDSHGRDTVRAVVGKMTEAAEVADGLEATFTVIDGPDGDEVYRRVTGGYVDALSIGYEAMEIRNPTDEEQRRGVWRFLKEIKLKEVSVVVFPMNPDARIDLSTVKSLLATAAQRPLDAATQLRALLATTPGKDHPASSPGLALEDPRRLALDDQLRALTLLRLGVR